MKIKKLAVKNFGIYEYKEFFFGQVSPFLDHNGAGKSTLLRALNFALSGDFEESMVRHGETFMAVAIFFESGLIVARHWKNGKLTHKMGYDKTKTETKEAVNKAVSALANTSMDKLKVVASSMGLFQMKPDALSAFFLSNIPSKMTADSVISYIQDMNPVMEKKARSVLPAAGEFGQEAINNAYAVLFEERRDIGKEVKKDRAKIEGYDFQTSLRGSKEIQDEISELLKNMGELTAKASQRKEWLKLKTKRQETLEKLHSIQDNYRAIKVLGVSEDAEERRKQQQLLKNKVIALTEEVQDLSRNIASIEPVLNSTKEIIAKLQEGACPQMKGVKCPNNWEPYIRDFQAKVQELSRSYVNYKNLLEEKERQKMKAEAALEAYETSSKLMERKLAFAEQFRTLRETLQEMPEEPVSVDMTEMEQKKRVLEKELKEAHTREEMLLVKEGLSEKEEVYKVLDRLVPAFSPKGEIIEKNLLYYLGFFEKQINEKAEKLGYRIEFAMDNGLIVRIGRKDRPTVDIRSASGGEKAVALFLLLDLFNSITGVNLLFLDEVEAMDEEVFDKLISLIKEQMDTYDHIILAGVDHKDLLETIKKHLA